MHDRVAVPTETSISVVSSKNANLPPWRTTGNIMLKLVLSRLMDDGLVTSVKETSFTIVKKEEAVTCSGDRADIYLAIVLVKFCQRAFGKQLRILEQGTNHQIACLLSRIERIAIIFEGGHAKKFVLPAEGESLMNTIVFMACNALDVAKLDEPDKQNLTALVTMAREFVSKPFSRPKEMTKELGR